MEIFAVIGMLVIFPFGATIIGAIYIRMFLKLKIKSALLCGFAWIFYSVYEYLMYTRVLCSGECNIRIDLLFIYPFLLLLSMGTTLLYYRKKAKVHKAA